jgi:hypothetical protein
LISIAICYWIPAGLLLEEVRAGGPPPPPAAATRRLRHAGTHPKKSALPLGGGMHN